MSYDILIYCQHTLQYWYYCLMQGMNFLHLQSVFHCTFNIDINNIGNLLLTVMTFLNRLGLCVMLWATDRQTYPYNSLETCNLYSLSRPKAYSLFIYYMASTIYAKNHIFKGTVIEM